MSPSTKFPRLLADENVKAKLVKFLSEVGCDVCSAAKGLKNSSLAALAKKEKRVLLTHDKDFLEESLYPPKAHEGIIVLAIHPPELPKLESALKRLLETISPDKFAGKVFLLSEAGVEIKE